jgi:hypothetical protein
MNALRAISDRLLVRSTQDAHPLPHRQLTAGQVDRSAARDPDLGRNVSPAASWR